MVDIRIQIVIHNRYLVFDASGELPFSIVYGLCRRSKDDLDARDIILHTAKSALDVPYAIANGLLTLHEKDDASGEMRSIELDLLDERKGATDSEEGAYLTLSSPMTRTKHWKEDMTVYQYPIDSKSELGSLLKPGRAYTIRLASSDLGVKWWRYSDNRNPTNKADLTQASETARLVRSKSSGGKASFKVVSSLTFPPAIEMHMRLCPTDKNAREEEGSSNSNSNSGDTSTTATLEVSVCNTHPSRPISVQTRGTQRFLMPWGPMQPESEDDDSQVRIIDGATARITADIETTVRAPIASLQIVDIGTDTVVRAARKPGPCRGLTIAGADPRPRLNTLLTLRPGETLIRRVDIRNLVKGLPDGAYRVEMRPRGVWWCFGDKDEIADEDREKVARGLYKTAIPPLVLRTEDVVSVKIRDGNINRYK
ncbi:hypothetical protein F5B22DRAFT_637486 [Xylaria bambusicola]|uniref:uncharacterized protein n=1 Tax=Xylaria bambusicola TaxID=326684 RepID=UPI00200797B9|nr:uncharacterized protein F5B22DRAFT_637486 [Xylaria bambusicola]KAI0512895.1 hypothetical protein F5B22DRAFT_637486 [Xylaria bambusicola]